MGMLIDPNLSELDNVLKLINATVYPKYGILINDVDYSIDAKGAASDANGKPRRTYIINLKDPENGPAINWSRSLVHYRVDLAEYQDVLIDVNGYQLGDVESDEVPESAINSITEKMKLVNESLDFEWLDDVIVVDSENGYKARKVVVSAGMSSYLYHNSMTLTVVFGLIDINVTKSGELVLVSDEYRVSNVFKTNGQYVIAPTYNDISSLKVKEGMLLYKTNYTLITIPNPKGLLYRIPGY